MQYKNIILTGFMGSGKTTVGNLLSQKTGLDFFDTDDEIVKNEGMEISLIFEKFGERYFRMLENTTIQRLSKQNHTVIATGGGIVKCSDNMDILMRIGTVIYLRCSPEKIYANTLNDHNRPLLNVKDRYATIRELLNKRKPLYEEHCHFIVDASEISAESASEIILNKVRLQ